MLPWSAASLLQQVKPCLARTMLDAFSSNSSRTVTSSFWPVCSRNPSPLIFACIHTSCIKHAPPPKKTAGAFKAGMVVSKKRMEVESDPVKLVTYLCGGQFRKEGPEIKIAPESDYPDWLFKLRTDGDPTLDELDPQTEEYWEEVRRLHNIRNKSKMKATKGRIWQFVRSKPQRYKDYIRAVKAEWRAEIKKYSSIP